MKLTRKFTLERPARKAGGDRYEEQIEHGGDQPMMGTTYVNQSMSRPVGVPATNLWITISTEPPD